MGIISVGYEQQTICEHKQTVGEIFHLSDPFYLDITGTENICCSMKKGIHQVKEHCISQDATAFEDA